jgi:hypothetical protein
MSRSIFPILLSSLIVLLIACSVGGVTGQITGAPKSQAKEAFEQWAGETGIPYEDVRYETLSDDGTFATVRVTAFFAESPETGWREMQADVECRKVAGEWRCDEYLSFALSQAEQERILQDQNATATALMATQIAAQATATGQGLQMASATETALAGATATGESLLATETATAIEEQAGPIYQEALIAYDAEDWWQAYYCLRQVVTIDASYADASSLLRTIETEHPQGRILVTDGENIYLMDPWGQELTQVETGSVAALSPSGEKLAFVRGTHLRVGPLDGDHPVVLDFDLYVDQAPFVVWSPDQSTLLLPIDSTDRYNVGCRRGAVRFDVENNQVDEIISADNRFSKAECRVEYDCCSVVGSATWDPSGSRIAFTAALSPLSFSDGAAMWVLDLNTGTTTEIGTAYSPTIAWSPDGQSIAYLGIYGRLYTMSPDGSNARPLVDEDGLQVLGNYVSHVTWSPDGTKLLCVKHAGTWTNELWVVHRDGSSAIKIRELTTIIVDRPPTWTY